ncbi:MarR family transcriptional regulator [Qipengyuania sp. XHP0211]|uniref:MarR family transcriptional regulator n=1 Tax=Qipengyuania sp. XHP0211 TaxID=3038079 RepID=UPI00241DEA40|nr:MarR family transcriptional regulator [Qipengyuania sp. XHP0211]MDG5749909.1 MarR family transcriptional regulator [Qipengyuania sp. XHP0211]
MQADFSYEPVCNSAGCQIGVTVLADRAHIRGELRDDAEAAGFCVLHSMSLAEYANGAITALGDVLLVDCAEDTAEALALLSRLDMRAGKAGTQMVVSTTMGALDAIFGCFSSSAPQILVDPCRSERVIAIGRVLAHVPNLRLRELGEEDRMMLLRLTEQVGRMAERLEKTAPGQRVSGGAFRLEAPQPGWRSDDDAYVRQRPAGNRPRLPDAGHIRQIIKHRQARARYFDGDLFADPAWDMLLDLAAARAEGTKVCVTSLCIASGVPATTALRWIGQMVETGLLVRVADPEDRRRAHIALSEDTADAMARYFSDIAAVSPELVAA